MGQFYIDESRADDPYALPDAEAFYVSSLDAIYNLQNLDHDEGAITEWGWYWWSCLPPLWRYPGCLPDSEARGPWPTEEAAITDARRP